MPEIDSQEKNSELVEKLLIGKPISKRRVILNRQKLANRNPDRLNKGRIKRNTDREKKSNKKLMYLGISIGFLIVLVTGISFILNVPIRNLLPGLLDNRVQVDRNHNWAGVYIPKPTNTPPIESTEVDKIVNEPLLVLPTIEVEITPEPTQIIDPTIPPYSGGVYTVQRGDTLFKIAQAFSLSVEAIASYNSLNNQSIIYAGQTLSIPPSDYIPELVNPPVVEGDYPPQGSDQYILVDISEQHLYAYESGELVFSFIASTGMGNSTRVGLFSVLDKIPNAYGATWDIWMPNWLGIYWSGTLENGIHALPILSNGVRLWSGYLGTPISYGCVVLGAEESKLLYDWVYVGTPVEIQW